MRTEMTPEHQAYCDAAAGVLNRTYAQRHGGATRTAPDGNDYITVQSQPRDEAGQAVQELEGKFRALIVDAQGDTIWWRIKPELFQDDATKKWSARTRFRIGFMAQEKPDYTPGSGHPEAPPACYPDKPGNLPQWRCHKVVRAARIMEARHGGLTGLIWMLDQGKDEPWLAWPTSEALRHRVTPEGTDCTTGYLVVYEDGYESWSPAKAFEDGYTRIEA